MKKIQILSFLIYSLYFYSTSAFASNETIFKTLEKQCKTASEKVSVAILAGVSGRGVTEMLKNVQGAEPKAIDEVFMPAYEFGKSISKVKSGFNYVKDINRELNDSCMSHLARFAGKVPDNKLEQERFAKKLKVAIMEMPNIFVQNYRKWLKTPSTLKVKLYTVKEGLHPNTIKGECSNGLLFMGEYGLDVSVFTGQHERNFWLVMVTNASGIRAINKDLDTALTNICGKK